MEDNFKIEKLKGMLSYTPLVSALLIFLGFLNYDLYYRKLGIKIFSFLETSELIFSFVNLIYPLIIISIGFYIFLFIMKGSEKARERTENQDKIENEQREKKIEEWEYEMTLKGIKENILNFKKNIISKKFRKAFDISKSLMFVLFVKINILCMWVFGIYFGAVFYFQLGKLNVLDLHPNKFLVSEALVQISLIWLIIFFIYILNSKKIDVEVFVVIMFLMLISNLNIYQNSLAVKTYNDLNEENVHFEYDGNIIETSGSKSLMGITKNYLFLRETSNDENFIYKISDIKNLKIYYNKTEK